MIFSKRKHNKTKFGKDWMHSTGFKIKIQGGFQNLVTFLSLCTSL